MSGPGPVLVLPRKRYASAPQVWLRARKRGIGASDAAAILGMHPWQSPLSLYVDKRTPHVGTEESQAMRWGRELERTIAKVLAVEHGKRLRPSPGLLGRRDAPYWQCTVDFMVEGENVPLEIKNTSAFKAGEWAGGAVPDHVVIQVHHQMMVGGWEYAYVGALVGGNSPRWARVDRDPLLCNALEQAEPLFWQQVQDGNPPDPIGHDADLPALALVYPGGGPDREADETLAGLFLQWQTAKEQETAGEQDAKVLAGRILAEMADDRRAVDREGRRLFTAVHVKEGEVFDQSGFRSEHPDLAGKFMKPRRPYSFVLPADDGKKVAQDVIG